MAADFHEAFTALLASGASSFVPAVLLQRDLAWLWFLLPSNFVAGVTPLCLISELPLDGDAQEQKRPPCLKKILSVCMRNPSRVL